MNKLMGFNLIFIILFNNVIFCQNIFEQTEMHEELIMDFIEYISHSDSMDIVAFRHFFFDHENGIQIHLAKDYCKSLKIDTCQQIMESINERYNQQVINYFFMKMKDSFHPADSIIEISRLEESRFLIYKVILCDYSKNMRKYYFGIGCDPYSGDFLKLIDPQERELYSKAPFDPLFFPCCLEDIFNDQLNPIIHEIDTNSYEKGASVLKELIKLSKKKE